MSLGIPEIILIILVVLVLFGGKKIPELARGLGKAQAEYQKAKTAIENEIKSIDTEAEKTPITKKKKISETANHKKSTPKKSTTKNSSKKATTKSKTKKKSSKKSAEA